VVADMEATAAIRSGRLRGGAGPRRGMAKPRPGVAEVRGTGEVEAASDTTRELAWERREGYAWPVLADGVWPMTIEEARCRLVGGEEPARARLWEGFVRWRRHVAQACPLGLTHWINGSFVEGKPQPRDVDVVSFVDGPSWDRLAGEALRQAHRLLHGRERTEAKYGCHAFMVRVHPPSHPKGSVFEQWREYWRWLFGWTSCKEGRAEPAAHHIKGIISISTGHDAPYVADERGNPCNNALVVAELRRRGYRDP